MPRDPMDLEAQVAAKMYGPPKPKAPKVAIAEKIGRQGAKVLRRPPMRKNRGPF